MRCSSTILMITFLSTAWATLQAQTKQAPTRNPPQRGFHVDGGAWLWPAGAQEISGPEFRDELVRPVKNKLVLAWTMDRGVADLIAAANESRLDQNLTSGSVIVRVFYQNGKTEDLPTRAVILRPPGSGAQATDQMLVEVVMSIASDITNIQLIDHQSVVAWAGAALPHLFEVHPSRYVPAIGTDFLPTPLKGTDGKESTSSGTMPGSSQKSRRALQVRHIEQGLYPPFD